MALKVYSDASYLSAPRSRSRVGGNLFLGNYSDASKPNMYNVTLLFVASILKHVVSSAAEVEMGALFINMKEAEVIRTALEEMVRLQHEPTAIATDNSTEAGIANDTINKRLSKAMYIRFYCCQDQV